MKDKLRIRYEETAYWIQGDDGQWVRKVKPIVLLKAGLAVSLPLILVLLIMLGLLISPVEGKNIFQVFLDKVSGN
jgi:hypothetical protein